MKTISLPCDAALAKKIEDLCFLEDLEPPELLRFLVEAQHRAVLADIAESAAQAAAQGGRLEGDEHIPF